MDVPRPTVAPPGRLVRLGVVLDTRNPIERLLEVARMCDRAGIGALWVEDVQEAGVAGDGAARLDAWTALVLLAGEVRRARIGAVLDADALPAERPTIGVQTVPPGGTGPAPGASASEAPGGTATPLGEVIAAADDLVLPTAPLAATQERAAAARQAALGAGRGPGTLGVAARLPVSVGRTSAEAEARWQAEPAFAALGDSEQAGLFGTLEQCHDRVVALAHAGVSDLRCLLPNAIDIHDVIAPLTAMPIGSADKLVPGAPRTRVPEPPAGWGGRSRFPRPS